MKTILVIIPFLFLTNLMFAQSTLNHLHWLEGSWSRTNVKPGRSAQEYWKKISDTEWHGLGVTLSGSDTAFVEKLKLMVKDGSLYYVADVPENNQLVYFKFTEITESSFICENLQHDFPKRIAYVRNGDVLKATISGDGRSFEYFFERKH